MKINTKVTTDEKTFKEYMNCISNSNKGFINQLLKDIVIDKFTA